MVALVSGAAGTVAASALTVQDAEAVAMAEVVPAETVVLAETDVAAGTAEVAVAEAVGTVEVVEALGHQLLCAVEGGIACSQVSAEGFVVPAQFSGAVLLWGLAVEPVVFLPTPAS